METNLTTIILTYLHDNYNTVKYNNIIKLNELSEMNKKNNADFVILFFHLSY